jgi:hypothetical protein
MNTDLSTMRPAVTRRICTHHPSATRRSIIRPTETKEQSQKQILERHHIREDAVPVDGVTHRQAGDKSTQSEAQVQQPAEVGQTPRTNPQQ